jgi:hypothetical protein
LTFLGAGGDRLFFCTDFQAERGRVVAVDGPAPRAVTGTELMPQQADAIAAHDQTGGNALGMYGNRFVLTIFVTVNPTRPYTTSPENGCGGSSCRPLVPSEKASRGNSPIPTCSTRSSG